MANSGELGNFVRELLDQAVNSTSEDTREYAKMILMGLGAGLQDTDLDWGTFISGLGVDISDAFKILGKEKWLELITPLFNSSRQEEGCISSSSQV